MHSNEQRMHVAQSYEECALQVDLNLQAQQDTGVICASPSDSLDSPVGTYCRGQFKDSIHLPRWASVKMVCID